MPKNSTEIMSVFSVIFVGDLNEKCLLISTENLLKVFCPFKENNQFNLRENTGKHGRELQILFLWKNALIFLQLCKLEKHIHFLLNYEYNNFIF